MLRKRLLLLAVLPLMAFVPGKALAQAPPRVVIDRADYAPGSTVYIFGTGFAPGEGINLQVLRIDLPANDGPEHQPWQAKANEMGDFASTWLVTPDEAGATLQLTATGLASGLSAHTVFTDSAITPATGGQAISADTFMAGYTPLTGPVITETTVSDIDVGTIVLATPAGFTFDTNSPLPFITLNGENGNKNINGLTNGAIIPLTVTTTNLSFTVISKSKGQSRNTLTYSNVRVRPTVASPCASGNITNTGTSTFPNSTTNFGTLTEVAGALARFAVSGFPSPQTAGVAGSVTVIAQDQFGNTISNYAGTVRFTCTDPQAVLPANYSFVAGDYGTHTFSAGVTLKTAGTQSITVLDVATPSSTGTQSGISVNPASAAQLVFSTQPGSAVYGSLLSPQPALRSQDAYGNNSTVGLGTSKLVSLNLSGGTGPLAGTASLDIGTGAGNGSVTFTNLTVKAAGSGKQLTASATGLNSISSSNFTITQATVVASVTASNKVYDGTISATIATRTLGGVIGSDDVALAGGTAAFATRRVGNGITVTATGLGLSGTASGNYVLASTTATTTAAITPAALTVVAAGNNKVYDGATAATVTLSDNRVSGDSLAASYAAAAFSDKNVGNDKSVNVTGILVTGADAGNYTANTTAVTTANITPATLTGTAGNQTRLYGETNAPFVVTYGGFVTGEDASILTGTLNVSTTADAGSPVGSYSINPSGQSAPNYNVQYVPGVLTIARAPLVVAANNATRGYGEPNPSFTATMSGFVNGEDAGVLGGALTLTTDADTASLPGQYLIVPAGLLASNYSITYSNGNLTITSTNHAPVLALITNATVRPDQSLLIKLEASDVDGDRLAFSLDPGAPAGAIITNRVMSLPARATNTVFWWRPTRAQASTTNLITVRVTDDGGPPISTAQTFTVVVLDYLELTLGSTNLEGGQSVAVPINLASSDGVTNLEFNIAWPASYLANPALQVTAPGFAASSLQDQGANLVIAVQTAPGQILQGDQQLGLLTFAAISKEPSAFLQLPIERASAVKPDGSAYVNYITPAASVALVEGQPLLRASIHPSSVRMLTLYGRFGASYQLQYSTNLALPDSWVSTWSYVQTNGLITFPADTSHPHIFYRIVEP